MLCNMYFTTTVTSTDASLSSSYVYGAQGIKTHTYFTKILNFLTLACGGKGLASWEDESHRQGWPQPGSHQQDSHQHSNQGCAGYGLGRCRAAYVAEWCGATGGAGVDLKKCHCLRKTDLHGTRGDTVMPPHTPEHQTVQALNPSKAIPLFQPPIYKYLRCPHPGTSPNGMVTAEAPLIFQFWFFL